MNSPAAGSPCGSCPSGTRLARNSAAKVVESWIGGTTAPVVGSMKCDTCARIVSMVGLSLSDMEGNFAGNGEDRVTEEGDQATSPP